MTTSYPAPGSPVPPGGTVEKQPNGVGLAALIVGIVAAVFAIVPLLSFIAWLPAIAAIVLGIVGLVLKNRKRLTAWLGLGLGIVAWAVAIVVSIASVAGVAGAISEGIESASAAPVPGATTPGGGAGEADSSAATVKIQYQVESDGSSISNISYATYNGGTFGSESATEATSPFVKELDIEPGGAFDVTSFTLTAISSDDASTITCRITRDGEVVAEQTSTGPYSVVTCNVTD